jgi:peptide deformylase
VSTTLARYPNASLGIPSLIVDRFGHDLKPITDELIRVRDQTDRFGVNAFALAAPQIGVNLRVFLWRDSKGRDRFVVNPEILAVSGSNYADEQCLSFLGPRFIGSDAKEGHRPGLELQVDRPSHIVCRHQDESGEWFQVEAGDIVARMFCHEIDHLNGLTFLDRVTKQVRKQALRRWAKMHPDQADKVIPKRGVKVAA